MAKNDKGFLNIDTDDLVRYIHQLKAIDAKVLQQVNRGAAVEAKPILHRGVRTVVAGMLMHSDPATSPLMKFVGARLFAKAKAMPNVMILAGAKPAKRHEPNRIPIPVELSMIKGTKDRYTRKGYHRGKIASIDIKQRMKPYENSAANKFTHVWLHLITETFRKYA